MRTARWRSAGWAIATILRFGKVGGARVKIARQGIARWVDAPYPGSADRDGSTIPSARLKLKGSAKGN